MQTCYINIDNLSLLALKVKVTRYTKQNHTAKRELKTNITVEN